MGRARRLVLNRETVRELQDSTLELAVGGGTDTILPQTPAVDTQVNTVCGFDPPPWVSTSPPTSVC
jgi:hypothetical protein